MAEITAALDEAGANQLLDDVIAGLGPLTLPPGSGSLGPFNASYTVNGVLSNGTVDLIPPDIVRIADLRLDWSATLSFGIDLADILPRLCLPQVCIDIPCVGEICTPEICIPWPSVSVTVPLSDFAKTTVDARLKISLVAGEWKVEAEVAGVPSLSFGPATAAMLLAIGAAVSAALLLVPFIGPFLALGVQLVVAAIGIGGLTGLLGPMLSPFLTGLRFELFKQKKAFEMLPAAGPNDPKVTFQIDMVSASVAHNAPEDELVLVADISP